MKQSFSVQNTTVTLYSPDSGQNHSALPLVCCILPGEDPDALWAACQQISCPAFILMIVTGLKWDADLTPWPAVLSGGSAGNYAGQADIWLQQLTKTILPAARGQLKYPVSQTILAGYSLSGLFALYAFYRTDCFQALISCSGSFWYPDFVRYALHQPMSTKPDSLYFSLGAAERKTRNPLMTHVQEDTEKLVSFFENQSMPVIFVLNPGGHFHNPYGRLAQGILWTLQQDADPAPSKSI